MFYDTDLDTFLDEFGTDATYNSGIIRVIFDAPGSLKEVGGITVQIDAPEATAKTSDVSGAAKNSQIVIGGTTYYMTTKPVPDGTGFSTLYLSEDQV